MSKNNYATILPHIINTPLMITWAKLEAVLSVLHGKMNIPMHLDLAATQEDKQLQASAAMVSPRRSGSSNIVNIAVIPVIKSLAHRNANAGSGIQSYESIRSRLQEAASDNEIGGIMLDVESHGGSVAGNFALAADIRKIDEKNKPVFGIARDSAFSAACSLLSATRKVFLTETAGIGSIGVIAVHADQSGWNKKTGVRYTPIFSGARKNDFSPHEPLSKAAFARLQTDIDKLRHIFATHVANYRSLETKKVLATEAGTFLGQEAVDIGLADQVATWDEAIDQLAHEIKFKNTRPGGTSMTTQQRLATLIENNDDAISALAELGFVNAAQAEQAAHQAGEEAGRTETTQELTARSVSVLQVCQLGDVPLSKAIGMIKDGITVEQAQEKAQQFKADNSKKTKTNSTTHSFTGDGKHPLVEACENLGDK